jgi:hypothetical protein
VQPVAADLHLTCNDLRDVSTAGSAVLSLHLAGVTQMVTSISRTATLQSQLVFLGRLGQLTLVAYLKLLRVVIAERLWSVDDISPPKETSL